MNAPARLEVDPAARASSGTDPLAANEPSPAAVATPDGAADLASPALVIPIGDSSSAAAGAGGSGAESNAAPVGVAGSGSDAASECWQLPIVTRARILAAPGSEAALVGGKIM